MAEEFIVTIDDRQRVIVRMLGVATSTVLPGRLILGAERTPMLEGGGLAGYRSRSARPPVKCAAWGCRTIIDDDIVPWKY